MSRRTPGPWRFTPGPWVASGDADRDTVYVDTRTTRPDGYRIIAQLGNSTPRREADARLIAAAPELLDVAELAAIRGRGDPASVPHLELVGAVKRLAEHARTAIAKVEGRS